MRRANAPILLKPEKREEGCETPKLLEKKKPILLRQLENELRHLDEIDEDEFNNSQDPYLTDSILDRLQMIAKESARYELKEIEKLCKLAIGKRILNIELKKKKDEHNSKLKKKEKIEMFFRENRIKKYSYDTLIDNKLKDNTLVVRAYENGKGFLESTARYKEEEYQQALADCRFIDTIKEVNRIFYLNYSSLAKEGWSLSNSLLKIVWIPIILFVCLAISFPFNSFAYEQVILMTLFGVIMFILVAVSTKTFVDRPNNNNQIEQTVEDVQGFFERINQEQQKRGRNIEWNCSKDFMYLEVIFHDGFPTSELQ